MASVPSRVVGWQVRESLSFRSSSWHLQGCSSSQQHAKEVTGGEAGARDVVLAPTASTSSAKHPPQRFKHTTHTHHQSPRKLRDSRY